jgi:metal-responsive CopG/Arc/MetJ family transcriptional regulator
MKKKHAPKRSADDARVTFQLPKLLLEKIDAAAAAAFQNRSQFLVMHMTRVTSPQINMMEDPGVNHEKKA